MTVSHRKPRPRAILRLTKLDTAERPHAGSRVEDRHDFTETDLLPFLAAPQMLSERGFDLVCDRIDGQAERPRQLRANDVLVDRVVEEAIVQERVAKGFIIEELGRVQNVVRLLDEPGDLGRWEDDERRRKKPLPCKALALKGILARQMSTLWWIQFLRQAT